MDWWSKKKEGKVPSGDRSGYDVTDYGVEGVYTLYSFFLFFPDGLVMQHLAVELERVVGV